MAQSTHLAQPWYDAKGVKSTCRVSNNLEIGQIKPVSEFRLRQSPRRTLTILSQTTDRLTILLINKNTAFSARFLTGVFSDRDIHVSVKHVHLLREIAFKQVKHWYKVITYFLVYFHNSIYMKDCPFYCRCPSVPYQLNLKDTIHNLTFTNEHLPSQPHTNNVWNIPWYLTLQNQHVVPNIKILGMYAPSIWNLVSCGSSSSCKDTCTNA